MSLANGNLVALDQETGETLWTFETGAPLVSSTPPDLSSSGSGAGGDGSEEEGLEGGGAPAPRPKDSIFPGTDGSLYAYRPAHGGEPSRIEVRRGAGCPWASAYVLFLCGEGVAPGLFAGATSGAAAAAAALRSLPSLICASVHCAAAEAACERERAGQPVAGAHAGRLSDDGVAGGCWGWGGVCR